MRFLCLPGMGTSAQILEAQLSQITSQLPGQHTFTYISGEVETEPAPGIESFYSGPYYSFYELPSPDQIRPAFELIDEVIDEEGPFDGLIGFSQGSAVGSSYIINDARLSKPRRPFKCAIFFCASMPFDVNSRAFTVKDRACYWADTGEKMEGFDITQTIPEATSPGYSGKFDSTTKFCRRYGKSDEPLITIPTTHIAGLADDYYSQSCKLRDVCTAQNREFTEHRGGHEIPKDRMSTTKITQCIQNMLQAVLVG